MSIIIPKGRNHTLKVMERLIECKKLLELEVEPTRALEAWAAVHEAECTGLMLRFAKLHFAIHAQKPTPRLEEVKSALAAWENEMMDWYLQLEGDIVNVLRKGYGGPRMVTRYYAAIEAAPNHQENYRKLRSMFDAFMDA